MPLCLNQLRLVVRVAFVSLSRVLCLVFNIGNLIVTIPLEKMTPINFTVPQVRELAIVFDLAVLLIFALSISIFSIPTWYNMSVFMLQLLKSYILK